MRSRTATLSLSAALVLSPALVACSEEPQTTVTDEGVIETPSGDQDAGLDAPSGEPLVPDSSASPGVGVTTAPTPS